MARLETNLYPSLALRRAGFPVGRLHENRSPLVVTVKGSSVKVSLRPDILRGGECGALLGVKGRSVWTRASGYNLYIGSLG